MNKSDLIKKHFGSSVPSWIYVDISNLIDDIALLDVIDRNTISGKVYEERLRCALEEVYEEVQNAKKKYTKNFNSQHEAFSVIKEEVDELWDEIKKKQSNYDLKAQRKEAIQAAAMLMRLCVELLSGETNE